MILDIGHLVVIVGLPTAITGFCFWWIEHKLTKGEDSRRKAEQTRDEATLLMLKSINASISLGEQTAKSIKRLDPQCNGEMEKALDYARRVKHNQSDFFLNQGVQNINGGK